MSADDAAADPAPERTEMLYTSSSEVAGVEASVGRIHIPLPPEAGPRPEQCDWLPYLRFRDPSGPADSADADITQPGLYEDAGTMESPGRNTVRTLLGRDAAQQLVATCVWIRPNRR